MGNIYGTLPKSTAYSNAYNSASASVGGDFEMMSASRHNSSATASGHAFTASNGGGGGGGNHGYNTLGSYRVQYSSTNPFLPSFNPATNGGGGGSGGSDSTTSSHDKYDE